jgi:hypothetical protein
MIIVLAYELRDLQSKINALDPRFTATDFTCFRGTGIVG